MTLTRLIGDIHGDWHDYQLVAAPIEHKSIQVGDFGIGFSGPYWEDRTNQFHHSGQHRFIRGNHDKPETCKNDMTGYIADGTVENDVMYVGGAWSIDYRYRTEGVDWWRDEEASTVELRQFLDTYAMIKPRVMITHDCPTLAAYYMFIREGKSIGGNVQYLTRTAETLQAMFEIHQPEEWYFGHWHATKSRVIDGTKFNCLGICDFVDVEL